MNNSIKLDGLGAFVTYQIQISYANNISEIIGKNSTTEFYDLKTKPGGTVHNDSYSIDSLCFILK